MDVASTVYSLTIGILNFIAEHDDRQTLTKELRKMVQLVQVDLKPLFADPKSLETNESIKESLLAMQDTLMSLYYHLRLWKESKSHKVIAWMRPYTATQQLREDRQELMNHYIILMGATQIVDHCRGFNVITSTSAPSALERVTSTSTSPPRTATTTRTGSSTATGSTDSLASESLPFTIESKVAPENWEVTKFWSRCVGSKTTLANAEDFCVDISAYLAIELSPVACKRLLFRLDEHDLGHVAFSTLQELVKQNKMADVINAYSQDPQLPLLVWIDDDVTGNGPKVLEASKQGVTVIQLASTASAKTWIKINLEYLKAHDNPGEIRFISDQVRVETSNTPGPNQSPTVFENHNAGTEIFKFIRDQGLKAPILIYTDRKSLLKTRYVEEDPVRMAGSVSTHYKVFKDYVTALGAGRKDDKGWRKYNV